MKRELDCTLHKCNLVQSKQSNSTKADSHGPSKTQQEVTFVQWSHSNYNFVDEHSRERSIYQNTAVVIRGACA